VQELGDDQVGQILGDGLAEEDDPLRQQSAVDVEGALAASGLFDDHRDQWHFSLSFSVFREVLRASLAQLSSCAFPSLALCATIQLRICTRDERSSPYDPNEERPRTGRRRAGE